MTEFGDTLIKSAQEALAIAKGEAEPAGTFVPAAGTRSGSDPAAAGEATADFASTQAKQQHDRSKPLDFSFSWFHGPTPPVFLIQDRGAQVIPVLRNRASSPRRS